MGVPADEFEWEKGGKEEGNCPEKVFLGWESKAALSKTTKTTMRMVPLELCSMAPMGCKRMSQPCPYYWGNGRFQ